MPAMTLFIDLFFGVLCLVVLGVVLLLALLLVHFGMKAANAASPNPKPPEILALKSLWVKTGTGLGIIVLFASLIWKFVFAPPPVSDAFQEVFHQAPPSSVKNLQVPNYDSWGDSTIIDMTFHISKPDLLKLIGKNGKAAPAKDYATNYFTDLLKDQPGKPTSFYTSTKLCDPQLATCTCTIGYDDATKTAYVDSNALD